MYADCSVRKGTTTHFGVSSMRSPLEYRAAQGDCSVMLCSNDLGKHTPDLLALALLINKPAIH